MPRRRTAMLVLVLMHATAGADVCRWTNPDGSRAFGDRPPPDVVAACDSPPPAPAAPPPAKPAERLSSAEMEHKRQLAIRLLGSSDPRQQALGRELGRVLDEYARAVERSDQVRRQAVIDQRAVEIEFSDLTR